jgi:hypothetical protein
VFHADGRTGGQMNVRTLIVSCLNSANVPKKGPPLKCMLRVLFVQVHKIITE